ncbi:hypothetical protein RJ639_043425 [Escallonia herrerae]|uniref:Integrase zinc-binding domain-containing protein n=1 Tax=Escallonia herrerae TaxID=1293975 RepID=A0AA88WDK2_9ASTE|nr:hypothetical protein RJ639_043425 [Escallonia herrerae]
MAPWKAEKVFTIKDQRDKHAIRRAEPNYLTTPTTLKTVCGEELFLYLAIAESEISAVLVQEQNDYALHEVYEGIYGQHLEVKVLAHKILRQGYYWPTMKQDALEYSKQCDACQQFSFVPKLAPTTLTTLSSPIPFAMSGMDILGPFPPTSAQRKFVIVAFDYVTKWVEAEALSSITEKKCKDFL